MPFDGFVWQERVLIPLVAILGFFGTIILIPCGIAALVQWRKVAVARHMRELVSDLAKQGFGSKDIERIAKSLSVLQIDPEDEFSWDVPESNDDLPKKSE